MSSSKSQANSRTDKNGELNTGQEGKGQNVDIATGGISIEQLDEALEERQTGRRRTADRRKNPDSENDIALDVDRRSDTSRRGEGDRRTTSEN